MKVWHIPPSMLDTDTLTSELSHLYNLLLWAQRDLFPTRESLRYKHHRGFLFLRYQMVGDEVKKRLPFYSLSEIPPESVLRHDSQSPAEISDTERDIQTYSNLAEEFGQFCPSGMGHDMLEFMSMLNLSSPERIFNENEFLLTVYREEYQL